MSKQRKLTIGTALLALFVAWFLPRILDDIGDPASWFSSVSQPLRSVYVVLYLTGIYGISAAVAAVILRLRLREQIVFIGYIMGAALVFFTILALVLSLL